MSKDDVDRMLGNAECTLSIKEEEIGGLGIMLKKIIDTPEIWAGLDKAVAQAKRARFTDAIQQIDRLKKDTIGTVKNEIFDLREYQRQRTTG
ncbi:MAG: hypothetical protein V1807_00180 [Patescibacteria group bacterium]